MLTSLYEVIISKCIHVSRRQVIVLVQDGRVERFAPISSCESTKIVTSYLTSIKRRMLEPTKKDTPYPKTKKKLYWGGRRGAVRIKSNPIPAGWVSHKLENSNIKEVLALFQRFWITLGCPAWWSDKGTRNLQGIWPRRPAGFDNGLL